MARAAHALIASRHHPRMQGLLFRGQDAVHLLPHSLAQGRGDDLAGGLLDFQDIADLVPLLRAQLQPRRHHGQVGVDASAGTHAPRPHAPRAPIVHQALAVQGAAGAGSRAEARTLAEAGIRAEARTRAEAGIRAEARTRAEAGIRATSLGCERRGDHQRAEGGGEQILVHGLSPLNGTSGLEG
jgi:hypothetical protein